MTSLTLYLVLSAAIAFTVMSVLWLVQRRTGNAGIVDIGWSGLIPVLVLVAAGLYWADRPRTPVDLYRMLAGCMLAGLWGGRLVTHIHRRSHAKPEDRRYAALRKDWGEQAPIKFFWFFQFQAAAAVLFALPYVFIVRNPAPFVHPLEWIGLVLWLLAWVGETTADAQLAAFKKDAGNAGRVCDVGLWHYSRHPNYFFEWLIWCAVTLAALPAPLGWISLVCPGLMLFFLLKITGIPATEEQALKSKGDAYRRYQESTPMFIPGFKKKV